MNTNKANKSIQNQSPQKSPMKTPKKAPTGAGEGYSKNKQSPQLQPIPTNTTPMALDSDMGFENQDIKYTNVGDYGEGESIRVALRIRPMNNMELQRGDESSAKAINDTTCQISNKGSNKHYGFNASMGERSQQQDIFNRCGIHQLLDSVLEGYSATVFAYGQTGSGKTYTMSGVEEKLGSEVYISDETEGIIPRAFRYLWDSMVKRQEQFYVKASYMEIYNEQLRDLLNPASGVLHTRWNSKNGFFVEDLLVVECNDVADLVAVLHEGMKNRRKGTHELNQDSSRSHSILTVYIISEVMTQDQPVRKFGKISFVDLAGSERLKESKSDGVMIKETGNINKSLFTLGKVIKGLSDKKNKNPYIPYRDSKLTMLLMDSIGGSSKALMIACINPSAVYLDETLSTLNYATRTMNIKNKPVLQVDEKSQIVVDLTRENELLKLENQYLREQLQRVSNGLPIEMPENFPMLKNTKILPPLSSGKKNPSSSKRMEMPESRTESREYQMEIPVNKMIGEYHYEINRLKSENEELRHARDLAEKNYHILMNDNNALNIKLENLENVFIGNPLHKSDNHHKPRNKTEDEFMISNLMSENTALKNRIKELEEKNMELAALAKERNLSKELTELMKPGNKAQGSQSRQPNNQHQPQDRAEYIQHREKELISSVNKFQKPKGLY